MLGPFLDGLCNPSCAMQRPLQEHISRLEEKIVFLKRQLRNGHDLPAYQRAERELELSNAEQALALFRQAYELERQISD